MWVAIVYACLATSGQCITLEDTRGPYATVGACDARVEEMKADAAEMFSEHDDGEVRGWCHFSVVPRSRQVLRAAGE